MVRKLSTNPTMKEVKTLFAIHLIAISLVCGGHYTIISLQTSLYVEDGLGATTLTIHYIFMLLTSFVTSTFIQIFSLKSGIIFFDFSALIYCIVNFYPELYTLIPGAILCGIGKSMFWICIGCYTVYFARLFESCGSSSFESYASRCTGYMFSAFYASQVVANVVSYIVLETGDSISSDEDGNSTIQIMNMSEALTVANASRFPVSDVCGAKDCQDPTVTGQNISSYVPPNLITIYIIFSFFSVLCLLALALHSLFAPNGIPSDEIPKRKNVCEEAASLTEFSNDSKFDTNAGYDVEKEKMSQTTQGNALMPRTLMDKMRIAKEECRLNFRHFVKTDQLLLSGLQFYTGMSVSFVIGELTRGYASCVYGISKVGICMAIYNSITFLVSTVNGKVCGKFGRKYSIVFAFLCNAGTYMFCLVWIPTENSSAWIIYSVFLVCGVYDAIWISTTSAAVASFFPDSSSRGFTAWTIFTTTPCMLQYAWSTSVCVSYKIYILTAILCLAVFTHLVAEYRHDVNSSLISCASKEDEAKKHFQKEHRETSRL